MIRCDVVVKGGSRAEIATGVCHGHIIALLLSFGTWEMNGREGATISGNAALDKG